MNHKIHLLRPKPPWRAGRDLTVCGLDPAGCGPVTVIPGVTYKWQQPPLPVLGLEEFTALLEDQAGRMPYYEWTVCGRCAAVPPAELPSWDRDPAAVVALDVRPGPRDPEILRAELRALTALAAAHPEEFARLLEGEITMVTLAGL